MPQGSVLGPILFLIVISDLESVITNLLFKFADDTKLIRKVGNSEDRDLLSHDLQQLVHWSDIWQLPFNFLSAKLCISVEDP